jgi:hypothetical protein
MHPSPGWKVQREARTDWVGKTSKELKQKKCTEYQIISNEAGASFKQR